MKTWVRWTGYAAGGIAGVLVLSAAGVYGVSESRYRKQYDITPPALVIPTDSASVARGAHLASTVGGCVECHGENLAGKAVIEDAALAKVYALNLTRGKGGI